MLPDVFLVLFFSKSQQVSIVPNEAINVISDEPINELIQQGDLQ